MSKRVAQIAAVDATASVLVVVVVVLVRPLDADAPAASVPASKSAPAHGDFHKRLQPKLDGIGSARELPRVALAPDPASKRGVQKR
ncbi:Uncharacterised protein [Xylophilus ampelinus]|nr:Uncharacterised protein [Xylophilus ampelinus]|tara:strand:- start:378 stop:635 length:258 start_codon:yes stop_codon:yes gene_type:complete